MVTTHVRVLLATGVLAVAIGATPVMAQEEPPQVEVPWHPDGQVSLLAVPEEVSAMAVGDEDFCRWMGFMTGQTLGEPAVAVCAAELSALEVAWLPQSMLPFLFGDEQASDEPTEEPATAPDETAGDPLADLVAQPFADLKAEAKKPSYRAMLRNPDAFLGDAIYLRGEVLQAQDDDEGGQFLLVSVTKGRYGIWDDNVALAWDGRPRVIPDDIIEFVMVGTGNLGYESAGAGYLTVPSGAIVKLRIMKG
jgi:hypothetical protein